jgi:hypothetical protein
MPAPVQNGATSAGLRVFGTIREHRPAPDLSELAITGTGLADAGSVVRTAGDHHYSGRNRTYNLSVKSRGFRSIGGCHNPSVNRTGKKPIFRHLRERLAT